MASLTIKDYRGIVRGLIRDTAGGAATPDPTQYIFQDSEIDLYIQGGLDKYMIFRKRRLPTSLVLQPTVAQYTLPADWLTVEPDSFNRATNYSGSPVDLDSFASFVLPTLSPGMPLKDLEFNFYDDEQFVIVDPPPQVDATVTFDYFALHQISESTSTVPMKDKTFVAAAAGALALKALSTDRGIKMQKFKIGQGLQIDDSLVAVRLEEQAKNLMGIFEAGVVNRPVGEMG